MFAERFSSGDRARIDDKEMEALNEAATTMLSGLRGTGTTYYSYQYDTYGNWVELTINHSSRPDEPLSVNRRKLTYY